MLRKERRDCQRKERAEEEMLDQLGEDRNVLYRRENDHKMVFYGQAAQEEFTSNTMEVISFLKALLEEEEEKEEEEKVKTKEEPLTTQERLFVGVDPKTVEEEQEEDWEDEASHMAFTWGTGWEEVTRGKRTKVVQVGNFQINY